MAGSKIVKGAINKLIDTVIPGVDDAARQLDVPSLSRRLMVQDANKSALSGQGGDYYFGSLLDNPDFKAIDDELDIISQEHQYNMDPDFYDDEGIDVSEILPESVTNRDPVLFQPLRTNHNKQRTVVENTILFPVGV